MSRVAVIGEQGQVQGFALAGAEVRFASSPEDVRTAWRELPGDVAVVILTPVASDAVKDLVAGDRITVVMPS